MQIVNYFCIVKSKFKMMNCVNSIFMLIVCDKTNKKSAFFCNFAPETKKHFSN